MEANKFGFGGSLPPAFKFDPTDADIVAYYLLPRALNLPNPYADAIIEGDPASAPPWEILQRLGNLDHAFFFGPPADPNNNAGGKTRTIPGGTWQGQKGCEETVTLRRPGGGEVDILFKRYDLSFYRKAKDGVRSSHSSGYIMHEYEIISPPLSGTVLTRIKVPKKIANRQPAAPAAAEAEVLDPEQAGPSYENDAALVMIENAGYHGMPLQYVLPKAEYDDNSYGVSIQDQPSTSYNYDAAAMNGEGFAGAQAHAFYGGVMADTSGTHYDSSGYVPECDAEYQQWQYQQDPSNQYLTGDAVDEGFNGEQQAGALCGNSDKGSVLGTDTSAHSTISLCGDDIRFNLMVDDDHADLLYEQNGAGDQAMS